jgi:hypothetical protein
MSELLIYLRITGRPTECWAPGMAVEAAVGTYRITRILSEEPVEFGIGDVVRGEVRGFPDGSEALLAIEAAA